MNENVYDVTRVYICSPYAGDVETNVIAARRYSRFAFEQGVMPITPHLMYPQYLNDDDPEERQAAMEFNTVLLSECDELWVFGSRISQGMRYEISVAETNGQTIRYFTPECKEFACSAMNYSQHVSAHIH